MGTQSFHVAHSDAKLLLVVSLRPSRDRVCFSMHSQTAKAYESCAIHGTPAVSPMEVRRLDRQNISYSPPRRGRAPADGPCLSSISLHPQVAHYFQPAGTYVTSTDLGDAAVFATLFARLRDVDQVPHLIAGYQELRQRRVEYVVRADELNSQMVRTPAGPAQEARDARLRTQSKCSPIPVTEDVLREQWESIAGVYGYSAIDEAEAWWVNWGELRERAHNRTPQEMELKWDIVGVEQEEVENLELANVHE